MLDQPPSRKAEDGDLHALGCYQKNMLLGGGLSISLLALLLLGFMIHGLVQRQIAEEYAHFSEALTKTLAELRAREEHVRLIMLNMDLHRSRLGLPLEELSRLRSAEAAVHARRLLLQTPYLACTAGTDRYPDDLELVHSVRLGTGLLPLFVTLAQQRGYPLSGYVFGLRDPVLCVVPAPPADASLASLRGTRLVQFIDTLKAYAPYPPSDLAVTGRAAARRLYWLAPQLDPISGRLAFRMAQPIFDEQGAKAMLVANVDVSIFHDFFKPYLRGGIFAIADRAGRLIFHTDTTRAERGAAMLRRMAADSGHWRTGADAAGRYSRGNFIIHQPLGDTGWQLAYAYSWQTLWSALNGTILLWALITAAFLCVLWYFLWLFDRQLLRPLHERSQRVFESEQLSRLILTTAPVGLGLISLCDRRLLVANSGAQRYIDRTQHARTTLAEHVLRGYARAHRRVPVSGQPIQRELTLNTDEGGVHHLKLSLLATRYQGGDALLFALSDITAHKQAKRKLGEARRAAEAANRAKSMFLAAMSHEVRTPLNVILGNLELLECDSESGLYEGRLRILVQASRNLHGLLSNILDLSKLEAGEMTIDKTPCDVVDLLDQLGALYAALADDRGLSLYVVTNPWLDRRYLLDPHRLRALLSNLLNNALRFCPSGSITLEARPALHEGVERLAISVIDTGIGIPQADQARIFEMYYQVHPAGVGMAPNGGTGLGLPLCRRLAALMGGSLELHSESGQGSRFTGRRQSFLPV